MTGTVCAPGFGYIDGDFTLAEISDARSPDPPPDPAPQRGVAASALAARLWQLDRRTAAVSIRPIVTVAPPAATSGNGGVDEIEVRLLHAMETSGLWTPPVGDNLTALTGDMQETWLELAQHWAALATATGDLRFLNTACKLLGAVWIRRCTCGTADCPSMSLRGQLAATAHQIQRVCDDLSSRLAIRPLPTSAVLCQADEGPLIGERPSPGRQRLRLVVLAPATSGNIGPFAVLAHEMGLVVHGVCRFAAGQPPTVRNSTYAAAWYPATGIHATPEPIPSGISQQIASSWPEVHNVLARWAPDLVVLLGMPIVPESIITVPRLGVINAHNGALPGYRGMDAVGWALLNDDPVTCTVHRVTAAVDAGAVLAAAVVPLAPLGGLKHRVKTIQLRLLAAVSAYTAASGRLPDGTAQDACRARQFYRLHPHLKRLLDASPYGTATALSPHLGDPR